MTSSAGRFWRWVLIALVILECLPFWTLRYFPSQDGPSHLHNAVVMADYRTEPIYQEYYRLTPLTAAGNLLTQQILAGCIKVVPPLVAEKLLLTCYVILMFVSFRYFLAQFTPYADFFSPFAGVLAANWFLYKGFWNFSFSIPLLLLTVAYYIRQQQRSRLTDPRSLIVLMVSGVVLYMTHAVSWVVCVMAIGVLGLPELISAFWARRNDSASGSVRKALLEYTLPLFSVLPASILLWHLAGSQGESALDSHFSLAQRLQRLYSFYFLRTIASSDILWAKVVAVVIGGLFLFVLANLIRGARYNFRSTGVWVLSITCAVIVVAGPDHVGSGFYLDKRVALYTWLFFVVWLASALQVWSRRSLNALAALFCGIAIILLTTRFPKDAKWNQELSDIILVGQGIRPGSTVLMVNLDHPKGPVNPLEHAVGLLSGRTIVDLDNYEASFDYFTTKFQPDHSPFPALGTPEQLEAVPPVFNIFTYETKTHGRVDYLLFHGVQASGRRSNGDSGLGLYSGELAGFDFVRSAEGGNVRLYQRRRLPKGSGPAGQPYYGS